MTIAFRCTGCRCRIHVAQRRAGSSLTCPRCGTRVIVPASTEAAPPTRLEGRDVERSLAALEPAAGGTFADESFVVPQADNLAEGRSPRGPAADGVTVPRWALYAVGLAFPAVAAAAFACGCLWMATAGR